MIEVNKETISRLKFIGKIQIGDKVNIKNMYIQPDGLITQISRSILQDSRSKTLVFLQDTISKTFEILKCYERTKKNSDKIMCANLINDLKNSKIGIKNLKETYIIDIKFVCDLDTLLETIDAKLSEIQHIYGFSPSILPSTPPTKPPPPFPRNLSYDVEIEEGDDL